MVSENDRDILLEALYRLGNKGASGVKLDDLKANTGLVVEVLYRLKESLDRDSMIIDYSTQGGTSWGLNPKGRDIAKDKFGDKS